MLETMRDRGKFWTPAPDRNEALSGDGFVVRRLSGLGQTLVSGDLSAAVAALTPGAQAVGLWQVAGEGACAVRIARDRALLVTPSPLDIAPGWREGFAATPCDDGYAVMEIAGVALADIMAEAVSADLEAGSPSAKLLFAGIPALLYRSGEHVARLHVESPLSAYLWTWLRERA